MTQLADRVAAWVQDHPGRTAEEIAIGAGRRASDVRQVLRSPLFVAMPGPRNSTVYRLTGRAGTETTHKEKVLRLLSDGEWHSHHEGYALNVMLHSRVSDLRRDGYVIECDKSCRPYRYRLVLGDPEVATGCLASGSPNTPPLDETSDPLPSDVSSSDREPGDLDLLSGEPVAQTTDGQLVLDAPAFRRQAA